MIILAWVATYAIAPGVIAVIPCNCAFPDLVAFPSVWSSVLADEGEVNMYFAAYKPFVSKVI